jgi:hypothetical protein
MFEQSSPGFNRIWIFRNLQWVLCLKQEKRFFIEAPDGISGLLCV